MHKKLLKRIVNDLRNDKSILEKLPGGGTFRMDKPVPYLLINRVPPGSRNLFLQVFGKTETSYLVFYEEEDAIIDHYQWISVIAKTLSDRFGGFCIMEIWLSNTMSDHSFSIFLNQKVGLPIATKLKEELQQIEIDGTIDVAMVKQKQVPCPPHYDAPLMEDQDARTNEVVILGFEVAPFFVDRETGKAYPLLFREIRKGMGIALRKAFFEFIRLQTSYKTGHFEMLGNTEFEPMVWEIDSLMAEYHNLYDFLLLVTPINSQEAWDRFAKSKYRHDPVFHYRPIPIDPELIKRKLFALPLEQISDPTIAFLFRDKRKEIDRTLNMLSERGKPDFLHSSIQVFGNVEEKLLDVASALLIAFERPATIPKREMIDAKAFAEMARQELLYLKTQHDSVSTVVRIRDDIEGVMVSRGILQVGTRYNISKQRAAALIQHEIGTHVVTYYNGLAQPLKLFYMGVPGYEELQEGLAVMAEFLMGGLNRERIRILAARVVAVDSMAKGNPFTDTFFLLKEKYHFTAEKAFHICTRVYRGGGLTKDAVYLRGFTHLIEYVRHNQDLSSLLMGKIRQDYLPVVEELTHRSLLNKPPLKPRFLEKPFVDQLRFFNEGGNLFNITSKNNSII